MKPYRISILTVIYLIGSQFYALMYNDPCPVWLRCFYYIIQYSTLFYLVRFIYKSNFRIRTNLKKIDLFSLKFLMVYALFRLILYSFLIDKDMPTYVSIIDSKIITFSLSISVLLFTFAFNCLKK
jgi:hypothetical protein